MVQKQEDRPKPAQTRCVNNPRKPESVFRRSERAGLSVLLIPDEMLMFLAKAHFHAVRSLCCLCSSEFCGFDGNLLPSSCLSLDYRLQLPFSPEHQLCHEQAQSSAVMFPSVFNIQAGGKAQVRLGNLGLHPGEAYGDLKHVLGAHGSQSCFSQGKQVCPVSLE